MIKDTALSRLVLTVNDFVFQETSSSFQFEVVASKSDETNKVRSISKRKFNLCKENRSRTC